MVIFKSELSSFGGKPKLLFLFEREEGYMAIGIGTGLVVFGAKDLIVKLLGPTADYLGGESKNMVKKGVENLKRIFSHSAEVLGSKIDQPGAVSPRVLKHIINEGTFCEDRLSAEYFGGVLASSRTNHSRDDRGLSFVSLISSMSTYQIRSHYIFYTVIRNIFKGKNIEVGVSSSRRSMATFIPMKVYTESMDYLGGEDNNTILGHCLFGLYRLGLIDRNWASGEIDTIKKLYAQAEGPGIHIIPSPIGMELYLWVHGHSSCSIHHFLDEKIYFNTSKVLKVPEGSIATKQD